MKVQGVGIKTFSNKAVKELGGLRHSPIDEVKVQGVGIDTFQTRMLKSLGDSDIFLLMQ